MKLKPAQFEHNCTECVYLGHYDDLDLYVHPVGYKTVIARWGDEGSSYTSGIALSRVGVNQHGEIDVDRHLLVARLLAESQGLL